MKSIIAPVMTEKSVIAIDSGLYVFSIDQTATKNSIADVLKKLYDVKAISVRIVNLPAKKVNFKRKPGVRAARRKAYVQLAPKQHIPGFELPKDKDKDKDKDKK
ncbi:MAG: 50S ribosomal protein L23 [Patescibacteria group bacterium]